MDFWAILSTGPPKSHATIYLFKARDMETSMTYVLDNVSLEILKSCRLNAVEAPMEGFVVLT